MDEDSDPVQRCGWAGARRAGYEIWFVPRHGCITLARGHKEIRKKSAGNHLGLERFYGRI